MFFAMREILFPEELERALRPRAKPAGLEKLWEKLAKNRGMVADGEKHYSFSRAEAEAYTAYYLPANALKAALVIEEAELLGLLPIQEEANWLDVGTGPGTAYWGLAWWARERGRRLQFTGWDQSSLFTEIASSLSARSPFPAKARFTSEKKEDPISLVRKLAPTHVSFMNSLAEIYPDPAARKKACDTILRIQEEQSRRDGKRRFLLLLEPGSRESSRELAELKDSLGRGAALPCFDRRACGALVNPKDWCHEEVACRFPDWLNEIGAGAGMRKESILFSYALIEAGGNSLSPYWRVVSQRLERKGQVECWLCTPDGKKFARAQRSKAEKDSPLFTASRGEFWEHVVLGEKGDLVSAQRPSAMEKTVFSFSD